jgi:hypothetical protein
MATMSPSWTEAWMASCSEQKWGTIGHTGLLLALLCLVALWRRSPAFAALALGVATHLLLDFFMEIFDSRGLHGSWYAFGWPFVTDHFAISYVPTIKRHLRTLLVWPVIVAELVGMALIGWEVWRGRRRSGVNRL